MKDEPRPEFEEDKYIERLIKLRTSDPIAYSVYPQAVRVVVEEYEREKKAAQKDMADQK